MPIHLPLRALLAAAILAVSGLVVAGPVLRPDIPARELGTALKQLSVAANAQLVFADEVPVLRRSSRDYTADDALTILLQGMDLPLERSRSGVPLILPDNVRSADGSRRLPAARTNGDCAPVDPPEGSTPPPEQVTITAPKYDERQLMHEIVPRFVESHSVPTPVIEQIARWHDRICPSITGLKPAFNALLVRRLEATAKSMGVLTEGVAGQRKCGPKGANIEVIFTSTPQALLTNIERQNAWLLGSARRPDDTRFTRLVQSWYTTGTRAFIPEQRPASGVDNSFGDRPLIQKAGDAAPSVGPLVTPQYAPGLPGKSGLLPDAPYGGTAPTGVAGSYLGEQLRSELMHVLVIVDAQQLLSVSMDQLADYIALISLSRITQLDPCNELPSILDLLSASCSGRPRPTALTPADTAFLKALYSSSLDKKLNIEQGELRDRMIGSLLGKP